MLASHSLCTKPVISSHSRPNAHVLLQGCRRTYEKARKIYFWIHKLIRIPFLQWTMLLEGSL
jgi:hypothetical protein